MSLTVACPDRTLPRVTFPEAETSSSHHQPTENQEEAAKSVVHTVQGQYKDSPETKNTENTKNTEKTLPIPEGRRKRTYSPKGRMAPCSLLLALLKGKTPEPGAGLNKFLFGFLREVVCLEERTGNLYSMELLVEKWWAILDPYQNNQKLKEVFDGSLFCLVDELERIYEYVEAKANQAKTAHDSASAALKEGSEHPLVSESFPGKVRERHKLLCLFCRELAKMADNGGVFYLGNLLAAKILGKEGSGTYGHRAIRSLLRYGVIEEVSKGTLEGKKASSYRYLLPDLYDGCIFEAAKGGLDGN